MFMFSFGETKDSCLSHFVAEAHFGINVTYLFCGRILNLTS